MSNESKKPNNWDAMELQNTLKGKVVTPEKLREDGVPEEEIQKIIRADYYE